MKQITVSDPIIVKLSNKSFDHEAAKLIAAEIEKFRFIQVADLSDIIAGRPEIEALKVLETICNRF